MTEFLVLGCFKKTWVFTYFNYKDRPVLTKSILTVISSSSIENIFYYIQALCKFPVGLDKDRRAYLSSLL